MQPQLSGQNIISVFGVPILRTDSADGAPEDPFAASAQTKDAGGFWKTLNPFSKEP
jgi:hypothetical protein